MLLNKKEIDCIQDVLATIQSWKGLVLMTKEEELSEWKKLQKKESGDFISTIIANNNINNQLETVEEGIIEELSNDLNKIPSSIYSPTALTLITINLGMKKLNNWAKYERNLSYKQLRNMLKSFR